MLSHCEGLDKITNEWMNVKCTVKANPMSPEIIFIFRQRSSSQTASRPPSPWWWTSPECNPPQQPPQQAQQLLQPPQQLVTMISRRNISSRWLFLAPSLVVFLLLFSLSSYVFAADGERIFGLVIRDILLIHSYFHSPCLCSLDLCNAQCASEIC